MNHSSYTEPGETSLRDILRYIKRHLEGLLRNWYFIGGAGLLMALGTFLYATFDEGSYLTKPLFSSETAQGSSGLLTRALDMAGKMGLQGAAGSMGGDKGMDAEYLMTIAQSRRAVKSTLLREAEVRGKVDKLVNHFADIYELRGDLIPEDFLFSSQSLHAMSVEEDSLLTLVYDILREDHLGAKVSGEGYMIVELSFESKSRDFTVAFAEQLLSRTESYFKDNRTTQDRQMVAVIRSRADSVTRRLHAAEYLLAKWRDTRNRMVKARGGLEEMRLMRDVEILNVMNAELIANMEAAEFNLLQNTPVLAVIDEPRFSVTYEHMNPIKSAAAGGFIGVFLCSIFFILRKAMGDVSQSRRSNDH